MSKLLCKKILEWRGLRKAILKRIPKSPAPSSTANVKENQNDKPATTSKKKKRKDKPINGLLDILKKPDKWGEDDQ